jgi:hypothetical protein
MPLTFEEKDELERRFKSIEDKLEQLPSRLNALSRRLDDEVRKFPALLEEKFKKLAYELEVRLKRGRIFIGRTVVGDIASITFIIDGGGSAITTGQKGHLEIPFDCEIERVTLLADQTGSIVIDIWKDTYANFPPTSADSICGGNKPTISNAQKYQDSTLTGWTKTINAGDILAFNVDSAATITRVTLALKVKKI